MNFDGLSHFCYLIALSAVTIVKCHSNYREAIKLNLNDETRHFTAR